MNTCGAGDGGGAADAAHELALVHDLVVRISWCGD
jgi:hypothetical protein